MAFDVSTVYAGDYTAFDGYETVTLTPQNPAATAVESVPALRYPVTQQIIDSSDLGIESSDVTFWLWESVLAAVTPKNGDKITDGSSVHYTILSLTKHGREPQWQAICRQQT